ncbi:uncharacterized mitochondrial protein AtMg00810-like [Carya illinoinensis]|uniref:uncharacterized mitochondrial protein AtMg00810-like n=1 Tax=Carya illinoinensis TaxID=32201 RepID=UPI001C71CACE|nr:uncharacterized mitochondrial protein AtMg00810-like [Carya illinoinensis]
MHECKPLATPMPSTGQLISASDQLFDDPALYRSLVGGLQYLTFTRPDLSFSVNYVCQFLQAPTMAHFQLVKRILRYLQGTTALGLHITSNSSLDLYGFSDADWAGCPTTRRSTSGYFTFLGSNYISWSAKKQPTVARSSAEAEYRAMASTAAELTWLSILLQDLRLPLFKTPILHCDNMSALFMTVNPVLHAWTKHIELDYHYVRERVALGSLETKFVTSHDQLADLFTKLLLKTQFKQLRNKLGLYFLPQPSLGGNIRNEIKTISCASIKDISS